MKENHYQDALKVFQMNIEFFYDKWNIYDSYGEMLIKAGDKDYAIKKYERPLVLHPENENANKVYH